MDGLSFFIESTQDYLRILQDIADAGKVHREEMFYMRSSCGFQEEINSGSLKNCVDRKLNSR